MTNTKKRNNRKTPETDRKQTKLTKNNRNFNRAIATPAKSISNSNRHVFEIRVHPDNFNSKETVILFVFQLVDFRNYVDKTVEDHVPQ